LNAEAPDTAAVVERLDGEHAAATVAESEVPAGADAVHGGELGPPAPQERVAAVPPEPDGPDVPGLDAARADDEGLPGADLLGEFVGDALQCVEKVSHFLGRPAPALAKRAGRRNGGGVALTHQLVFAEERQQHPELLGGGRTTAIFAGGRRHGWAGRGSRARAVTAADTWAHGTWAHVSAAVTARTVLHRISVGLGEEGDVESGGVEKVGGFCR